MSTAASCSRGPGQGDGAFQLRAIAQNLLQAFERYYIAIAALVRNGPHTLSSAELENLCTLTAQRLSLLHELNAPEFFDKSLFRGFIQKLRERKVVWTDDGGKLDFDSELEERRARRQGDPEPRDPPRHPQADAGAPRGVGSAPDSDKSDE